VTGSGFLKKPQQHNQGFLKILIEAITLLEKSLTTRSRILENPPQLNHGFSEILSNTITLLKKSAAPDSGIFHEKPHNPTSLRQKIVMISCGPCVFGEDAMPIFSDNCRHQHCAF